MTDIITTLHPENDANTNLYPNIKKENIPNNSIDRTKLDSGVNSLLDSINSLHPSGVDTSTNILAFTEDKGIWVGSDNGKWYYWNGTNYVVGGDYQAVELSNGSIVFAKLDSYLQDAFNVYFSDEPLAYYQKHNGAKFIYNSQYNLIAVQNNQYCDAVVYEVEANKTYKIRVAERTQSLVYGFCANIPTTSQPYNPLNDNIIYNVTSPAVHEYVVTAPLNCYLLVTTVTNSASSAVFELNKIRSKCENIELKDITTAEVVNDNITYNVSTDNYNNYIYTNTGNIDSSLSNFKSKDIDIIPNSIQIEIIKVTGVYGGAFLDENKNWLSSFSANTIGLTYNIPNNAKYVNLTINITVSGNGLIFKTKTYEITNLATGYNGGTIPSVWYNKNILCIGTSVSFGQYATESYIHYASEKMGFNLINASVPGQAIQLDSDGTSMQYGSTVLSIAEYASEGITIADEPLPYQPGGNYNNYYRTWENIFNNSNIDLYVFDCVPNNTNWSLEDWNAFNKTTWEYTSGTFADHRKTFLGALLYLLDKMYSINPSARMVFVLSSSFSYTEGKTALETIANQYKIPIINLWSKINTTPKSLQVIKSQGGTDNHPSTFAHECMGKMFIGELMKVD